MSGTLERVDDVNTVKIEPLSESNYSTWSIKMQALLEQHGVWDVVETEPAESDATASKRNTKARSSIVLHVGGDLLSYIDGITSAKEAWDILNALLKPKGKARQLTLRRKLMLMRLMYGETLTTYFGRGRSIFNELKNIGDKNIDQDLVVTCLLAGLPKEYDAAVAVLKGSNAEYTFTSALTSLQEIQENNHSKEHNEAEAAALFASSSRKKTCFYCGRPGHFKFECKKRIADQKSGQAQTMLACAY